jgi:hypothetical protein
LVVDGGLDDEILPDGESDELGKLKVDGAEALEEANEVVGVAPADGEVGAAEGSPGGSECEVELFVVDAAKEHGVGGGTASADGDKGAALAEDMTEVERGAGIGLDFKFLHGDSRGAG